MIITIIIVIIIIVIIIIDNKLYKLHITDVFNNVTNYQKQIVIIIIIKSLLEISYNFHLLFL
jgi:hypothetical protein